MRSLIFVLVPCLMLAYSASVAAELTPPSGYLKPAGHSDEKSYGCPEIPKPFTGVLTFPSKYEGDNAAHDQINPEANAEYKSKTKHIDEFEKGLSKVVDHYMQTGNPDASACAVRWLMAWSDVNALGDASGDYTGAAVRKWALASISGSYVRLKFSSSAPLKAYPKETKRVEAWLGHIADKVVAEWPLEKTSHKINNHYYWAAWSVMATSVILDRKDLFDWSMKIYDIFASQVDNEGYLPYELARKTRAFSYHEFAIAPLTMVAAFAKANGVDAASKGNYALSRLANAIFAGMDNIGVFEAKAGAKQNLENSSDKSKHAWLEPYCSLVQCPDSIKQRLVSERPLRHAKFGGNVTSLFKAE